MTQQEFQVAHFVNSGVMYRERRLSRNLEDFFGGDESKMAESKKPTTKYRDGNVSVAKWENETKEGAKFYTYTVQVSYYDEKTKEWKTRNSVSLSDIEKVVRIFDVIRASMVTVE